MKNEVLNKLFKTRNELIVLAVLVPLVVLLGVILAKWPTLQMAVVKEMPATSSLPGGASQNPSSPPLVRGENVVDPLDKGDSASWRGGVYGQENGGESIFGTLSEEKRGIVAAEITKAPSEWVRAIKTVSLVVENGADKIAVQVPVAGTVSAAEVMEKAAAENKLSWRVMDYGESMGVLVEEINGVANNSGQNRYWYLYVNGALSPVGASQAKIKAGDEITWKYELSKEQ